MRQPKVVLVATLILTTVIFGAATAQDLTDPHEILNKYFEASGGLERLKAERTSYFEGTLSLGGMEGSIKAWTEKPDRSRAEVVIGPLSMTQGDNGELEWFVDANGKVQKMTKPDEAAQKRKEVERLMAEYEYADPASDIFTVSFEGTETVEEVGCYVVKVANSINSDFHNYYIGTDDFLLKKSVDIHGEQSGDTYYGDYREVDGLLVAFRTREIPYQTGEAQEIAVTRYESNPDIEPGTFDPPEEGGKDYEFTRGNAAENIPFEFMDNHLFIPVVVNGREDLWVLDTGAGMSVLNKAFAEELGLELEGSMKGVGAGGTVDVTFAKLPPFGLQGISFKGQTVAVIDMNELLRRVGIKAVGILGFDFLSRFVTKVDYANELVSFYDPESFHYTGDGRKLDLHMKESVFETQAALDGKHSGTWLFDMGAGMTHLHGAYALRKGYTDKHGILVMGHGAANEMLRKNVRADSMQFAGFTVYEPKISFSYGGTDTVSTSDRIGTLGNTLFRNFVLYVDYANERVIVEKGDKFGQPWPEDHSGLQIAWTVEGEEIEVTYVSPDTPADEAGFQKGDIIKSVDGVGVAQLGGAVGIRKMLKAEPGTAYEFEVEREGRQKQLSLSLRELY
jgi:hypothetical protein